MSFSFLRIGSRSQRNFFKDPRINAANHLSQWSSSQGVRLESQGSLLPYAFQAETYLYFECFACFSSLQLSGPLANEIKYNHLPVVIVI